MTTKTIKKTITLTLALAAFIASTAAHADIQCGLDHPSRVAFDLTVFENVHNEHYNAIVKIDQWNKADYWLGKMTTKESLPNKLGDYKKITTIDLGQKGLLSLFYSKSSISLFKDCGRASCDYEPTPLPLPDQHKPDVHQKWNIKGQLVSGTQTINLDCNETSNFIL